MSWIINFMYPDDDPDSIEINFPTLPECEAFFEITFPDLRRTGSSETENTLGDKEYDETKAAEIQSHLES